jgi:hypothetical protein
MVDLDVIGSVMCNKDSDRVNNWEQIFKQGLQKRVEGHKFTCMMRKVMFGCLILLFVRDDSINSVKKMCTSKVKTGAGGMAANKGSTSIRFNYEDTSLMFLNCHLTSG